MAIKTDKPQELTQADTAAFESEAKNKSRGKVQVFEYDSDETPGKPARFWVAKPNRDLLMMVAEIQAAGNGGMARANDVLLNGCILGGDVEQLVNDDSMYFGILRDITALVEAKKKS